MKDAFTLIELLVSSVIFTIILAVLYSVLLVGDRTYRESNFWLELQEQGRSAMDGMLREIRQTSAADIISLNSERVDFLIRNITSSQSALISYYKSGENIVREHPSGTLKLISSNVSSLDFSCVRANGMTVACSVSPIFQIQLRLKKDYGNQTYYFPISGNLTGRVRLRNR